MMPIAFLFHDIVYDSGKESGFSGLNAMVYKIGMRQFREHIRTISSFFSDGNHSGDVIFTFDDGGVSAMDEAAILDEYGFKAIFFITTSKIGEKGFLNESQIKELASRGHIIGTHSHTHPYDKKKIAGEWKKSIRILEKITGSPIIFASSPHGLISRDIIEEAARNGIRILFTTKPTRRVVRRNGVSIRGRFCISGTDSSADSSGIISSRRKRLSRLMRCHFLSFIKLFAGSRYPKIKARFIKCRIRGCQ